MLKELIAEDETTPEGSSIWRASEVGECETYLGHLRLGHKPLPLTGRVRHMLQDGVKHEHDIVDRLLGKGVTVMHSYIDKQLEVRCNDNPYVSGHPDGILSLLSRQIEAFPLDYADENFKPAKLLVLEITAPGHFPFLRLKKQHFREAWWRKYVQIQMYLHSESVQELIKGRSCLVIVKNRNTSELYEEGVSLDDSVVTAIADKLKRIEDLAAVGKVSDFRCNDFRRGYCRYRHLCFGAEEERPVTTGILKGESLREAEVLKEAVNVWRAGKSLEADGKQMVQDAREQFAQLIAEYGCKGITMADVRALWIDKVSRRTDFDLLRSRYPDVYKEVVSEERSGYVRVV